MTPDPQAEKIARAFHEHGKQALRELAALDGREAEVGEQRDFENEDQFDRDLVVLVFRRMLDAGAIRPGHIARTGW